MHQRRWHYQRNNRKRYKFARKNKLVRIVVVVKRADKRRMGELGVEFAVNELVRSRLKWVGHVDIVGDEKLAKRADTQKVEGK